MLKNISIFFLAHLIALLPLSIHFGIIEADWGMFIYIFLTTFGITIIPAVFIFVIFTLFHFKFNESQKIKGLISEISFLIILSQFCLWLYMMGFTISGKPFIISYSFPGTSAIDWKNWFALTLSFTIPVCYHFLNRQKIRNLN